MPRDRRTKPSSSPAVVFVGHDASRSGAPAFLLHLTRWLRRNSPLGFSIVLLEGGPLLADFESVAPTTVLDYRRVSASSIPERALARSGLTTVAERARRLRVANHVAAALGSPQLLYCNTAASARLVPWLRGVPPTLVVHVHEMAFEMRASLGASTATVLGQAQQIVAPSVVTREELVRLHGVRPMNVEVVPECIDVEAAGNSGSGDGNAEREGLGIPAGDPVVVGCGTLGWRKGTDLFVQLAGAVNRAVADDVHFVWIGGARSEWEPHMIDCDVNRAHLGSLVHVIPTVTEPWRYMNLGDVFVLPSREDPFPLACLEAAALSMPIVCFDSSGMAEFVDSEAGVAVGHLDMEAMAATVVRLLGDPVERKAMGAAGRIKVGSYDVSVVAPEIMALIGRFVS